VWKDPLPRVCVLLGGGVYEMEDDGPGVGIGWVVWTARDSGLRPWQVLCSYEGCPYLGPCNGEGGGSKNYLHCVRLGFGLGVKLKVGL